MFFYYAAIFISMYNDVADYFKFAIEENFKDISYEYLFHGSF